MDLRLHRRRYLTTRLRSVAIRIASTTVVAVLVAVSLSLVLHVEIEMVHNRLVLVYPGHPSPGETVVYTHHYLAVLIALGPATVAPTPAGSVTYLAVNGMTTTWPAPPSPVPSLDAGSALVEVGTTYYRVPAKQIHLASPL